MVEKMNYCPECGELYNTKVVECRKCKVALEEAIPVKFCPKCRQNYDVHTTQCLKYKTHKLMDAYYTPKYPKPKPIIEEPKSKPIRTKAKAHEHKAKKAISDWDDDL